MTNIGYMLFLFKVNFVQEKNEEQSSSLTLSDKAEAIGMKIRVSPSTLSHKWLKWAKADLSPGNLCTYGHITLILAYEIEDQETHNYSWLSLYCF